MDQSNSKTALVTGASRGIGARVAVLLAETGFDVAINFRSKASRAEQVAQDVQKAGRRALLAQADMADENQTAAMPAQIRAEFGQLDVLVLNASGGMEKGKDADYALQLNRDAQVRTVDLALPLMPSGGRIVFVTSHLAHFYGTRDMSAFPGYEPVAASKKAGEDALRSRIPNLSSVGISLVVVSGDLIEGTTTPKLMERARPGLIEARRAKAGTLPTLEEFAQAIADAARDVALPSGATIFVGSVG